MFIKQISKQRPGQQSLCQTGFVSKNTSDSLGSISEVVTKKEDRDTLAEDKLVGSDDENSDESETYDEEYECVVCRLEFAGEAKFDEHRRIAQHWGSEILEETKFVFKVLISDAASAASSSLAVTSSIYTRKMPTTGQMMALRRRLIVNRRRRGGGRGTGCCESYDCCYGNETLSVYKFEFWKTS